MNWSKQLIFAFMFGCFFIPVDCCVIWSPANWRFTIDDWGILTNIIVSFTNICSVDFKRPRILFLLFASIVVPLVREVDCCVALKTSFRLIFLIHLLAPSWLSSIHSLKVVAQYKTLMSSVPRVEPHHVSDVNVAVDSSPIDCCVIASSKEVVGDNRMSEWPPY